MSADVCGGDLPDYWWRDKEILLKELRVHGTLTSVGLVHGVADSTLSKWYRRHPELPKLPVGHPPMRHTPIIGEPGSDDEWLLQALKRAGDNVTIEQLADATDTAPKKVRDALARLTEKGYRIDTSETKVTVTRRPPASELSFQATPELYDGDLVRFGVVSDTHLGSKECHLQDLITAYAIFERENIQTVYHPGDLVAGMGIYRHQLRDLSVIGFDNQVEFAVENYPSIEGITTHIVSGNHDIEGDYGRDGADPVRAFCSQRDDFVHMGEYSAWIDLPNDTRMHVLHPGGGGSYAISYRPQKIAEGYEGGTKPNVTLFGHWHRRADFTARNINMLLCGAFEGNTSLAKRYGLGEPALGFHIVECRMAEDGSLVEWNPRWYPMYRGRTVL